MNLLQSNIAEIKALKKENAELKSRLSQLEEDCPDCGGCGSISGEESASCPICFGSGKVPVCYLPDWFVEELESKVLMITAHGQELGFAFIKQPNGLSKLVKIN